MIELILRDGSRLSVAPVPEVERAAMQLYDSGIVAGYVITPEMTNALKGELIRGMKLNARFKNGLKEIDKLEGKDE